MAGNKETAAPSPEPETPNTGAISNDDLMSLATLAGRRRREAQETLIDRIVAMLKGDKALSEREISLIGDILIGLARDMDTAIRSRFSRSVARLSAIPRTLAIWLAKQDIDTAEPVISDCGILDTGDLLEILGETGRDHAFAAARRRGIDALVSAALVEQADLEVTLVLLTNNSAEISVRTFADLVRQSNEVQKLRRPLLDRRDLSPALAHAMFWWVSSALRTRILEQFSVEPDEVDKIVDQLKEAGITNDNSEPTDVIPISRKQRIAKPNVNDLVASLREKNPARFLSTMTVLLQINDRTARRIVNDQGGEALAVACRAMDADRSQFTSVFLLMDYQRYGQPRPTSHIEAIANVFNIVTMTRAKASVALWDKGDLAKVA